MDDDQHCSIGGAANVLKTSLYSVIFMQRELSLADSIREQNTPWSENATNNNHRLFICKGFGSLLLPMRQVKALISPNKFKIVYLILLRIFIVSERLRSVWRINPNYTTSGLYTKIWFQEKVAQISSQVFLRYLQSLYEKFVVTFFIKSDSDFAVVV